jgi:Tfp pilus assembly protein PilV
MWRSERGVTLMELLVACLVGWIVVLGVTSFYLSSLRFSSAARSQAALQRQGSAIADDIGRRLRSAQSVDIEPAALSSGNCMPLTTSDPVLVIQDRTAAFWCYYRTTSTPPQIVRCARAAPEEPCVGGSVLSGSLTPLSATAWTASAVTPCESAGGTCNVSNICSIASQSCVTVPGANVAFTLSDGVNDDLGFGLAFVFQRH